MQFFQILALVGVAAAHAVQTVTSVATATAPVVVADCTTVKPAVHTNSEWFNATQTVVVTLPPANTTAYHGANSTWGSGAKPTGTKPAPVTAGAAGTKASIAGLLGFAGVAMLVL